MTRIQQIFAAPIVDREKGKTPVIPLELLPILHPAFPGKNGRNWLVRCECETR